MLKLLVSSGKLGQVWFGFGDGFVVVLFLFCVHVCLFFLFVSFFILFSPKNNSKWCYDVFAY